MERSERTDLVISMTLAEIFLLLLFVVWFGYSNNPIDVTLAQAQANLETATQKRIKAEAELKRVREESEKDRRALDVLRRILPSPVFTAEESGVRNALDDWRKSFLHRPKCDDRNLLVQAIVANGAVSVSISRSENLVAWMTASGKTYPPIGMKSTSSSDLKPFLGDVQGFYASTEHANAGRLACRFEYDLGYVTKNDYYDGRQLFEGYFYPRQVHAMAGAVE